MNKTFSELLEMLKDMLPKGNMLSNCNYQTNKLLCPMVSII